MVGGGRVKSEVLLRLRLACTVLFSRGGVMVFSVSKVEGGGQVLGGICGGWSGPGLLGVVSIIGRAVEERVAGEAAAADEPGVPPITAADLEAAEAVADLLKGVGGADGSQG